MHCIERELYGLAAIEKLTDKAIQSAIKASSAAGKPKTIGDGGGLVLEARPTGAGWWRLRYSFDGRESRLSLGTYPTVTLADARSRRRDAMKLVAAGTDPSDARKSDRAAKAAKAEAGRLADAGLPGLGTFEHVARAWLSNVHEVKVSEGHFARTRIRLEQDVFP